MYLQNITFPNDEAYIFTCTIILQNMQYKKKLNTIQVYIMSKYEYPLLSLLYMSKNPLISLQMVHAPAAPSKGLGETSKSRVTDDDIERQLAALKDL